MVEAQTLKIASYNVENLFDMQRSGYEYKEYQPNRHGWTASMLSKKIAHLAEVICDLDADVIGLQEVENDAVLSQLQKVLKRVGCDYPYRAITHTKQTPIHNALLSKVALKKSKDIVIFRNGKHRSILEVMLKTDAPLYLFVNHWKSKAGPESQRLPYAKAMAKRIASLPTGAEYIMLGDFNSDYHEYQTMTAKHNDTQGKTGINHILKTIQGDALVRWHHLTAGYHYNLWLELPSYARWSHNFYGDKEGIDAIIVPASLHDGGSWEYQKGSFGVFKPDYLFGKRGRVKRWEYKHGKHTGKGYSDHLPVYALFSLGEVSQKKPKSVGVWASVMSWWDGDKEPSTPAEKAMIEIETSTEPKAVSIATLIDSQRLEKPVMLKDVKVIFKHRDTAIIKQHPEGRAILLYRCAAEMEVGQSYDILVYLKKQYKGLDELVDISVVRERTTIRSTDYIPRFTPEMMNQRVFINEVVAKIEGVIKKRKIIVNSTPVALYFKKGIKRPKDGSRIRIKRAQIGYYKNHNELVVWDQNDYQVLE
jgi:endonuclease/exonuclease/phosphatase family metal-dependent hydrolase